MKKRRLALLALVLTMVFITAFPMAAYAAERGNKISSWDGDGVKHTEELSPTHFPITTREMYIGEIEIVYTTSGNPISYVEVDGVRVPYQIHNTLYYQVVPGVYRYEHTFRIDVEGIVRPGTEKSLITFATGSNLYGIHVRWD